MASRSLAVRLTSDLSGLTSGLTKGQQHVRDFSKGIESVGRKASSIFGGIGASLAGAMGLAGGGFAIAKTLGLAQTQELAEKKLAATLEATGHAAGFSAGELKKYAAELQGVTNIGDEVTINAQAMLATFRNIRGDEFTRATELMLDMSAVMDTDLKSAAVQLGKALNDPAQGLSALTRVGVSFTEQQKEQVKQMMAVGDIAGAQKLILEELAGEFGGAARAMADPLTQAKNLFGDVGEEIGKQMLPTLRSLADAALEAGQWLTWAGGEAGSMIGTLAKYGTAVLAAKGAIALVNLAIRAYTTAQKAAASATIVTQMVMGPAGWIKVAAGLGAAGLAIGVMSKLLGDAEAKAKQADQGIGKLGRQAAGLGGVADEAGRLAGNLGLAAESPAELGRQVESLFAKLSAAKNMLADTTPAVAGYAAEYGRVASGQARGFSSADKSPLTLAGVSGDALANARKLSSELAGLTRLPGKLGDAARRAFSAFDATVAARYRLAGLAEEMGSTVMSIDQWEQGQRDLDAASREYLATVTEQVTAIGELEREVQAAIDVFGSLEEAWKFGQKVDEDLRSAGDAIDETVRKIQGLVDLGLLDPEKETAALQSQLEKAFGGVSTPAELMDAQSALNDLYREGLITAEQLGTLGDALGEGFDRAIGGPQAYLDDLAGRVEAMKNGWTDAQKEIEKFAATPGVTAAQVDEMRSLNEEIERLQEGDRLKKQGESLVEQFRTPEEKLRAQAADLEKLLAVGAIDLGTAQRAMQSYAGNLGSRAAAPGAHEAGSREAYSAMVRHQAGGRETPPYVRDQLAKLERIAKATEGLAVKEEVVEEVDI